MSPEDRYDLASVSKAIFALALVRRAHREGWSLSSPLAAWWPLARGTCVGDLSIESLLCHRSGLPAWMSYYREFTPREVLTGHARDIMLQRLVSTVLEDPIEAPRCRYSDVGYMLLGQALAHRAQLPLSEMIAQEINVPLALEDPCVFRPIQTNEPVDHFVPTEQCPWRGILVQGAVHDENAWVLGGSSGHAGLFGSSRSLVRIGMAALDALRGDQTWFAPERMRWMTEALPGGSNRRGWDGRSEGVSQAGNASSLETFGHLGFTGTSIWCDPKVSLVTVLLTNRVHPTREREGIRALRTAVHDAIYRSL